ncbi:hypothetical protein OIU85_016656 [Salix viminalis]|uniref:Uncharacterized protein n=1 Tax=Salix viminalis TaxID=40686 RepID=A0A9Q0V5P0_SALVM|nr:hypothetical protein OIU85_016656 [Salix viminalis]
MNKRVKIAIFMKSQTLESNNYHKKKKSINPCPSHHLYTGFAFSDNNKMKNSHRSTRVKHVKTTKGRQTLKKTLDLSYSYLSLYDKPATELSSSKQFKRPQISQEKKMQFYE